MSTFATILSMFLKCSAVLFIINEVRGMVLAVPVLVGIYKAGGDWMAIWIGVCSLAGIALSVVVPLIAAKRLDKVIKTRFAV